MAFSNQGDNVLAIKSPRAYARTGQRARTGEFIKSYATHPYFHLSARRQAVNPN